MTARLAWAVTALLTALGWLGLGILTLVELRTSDPLLAVGIEAVSLVAATALVRSIR